MVEETPPHPSLLLGNGFDVGRPMVASRAKPVSAWMMARAESVNDTAPWCRTVQWADTPAAFVAVFEFPSAQAAEAVFEDPHYQPLVEVPGPSR